MIKPGETFYWVDTDLIYETGVYNRAAENERAVEVPIAKNFLARRPKGGDILEVGNVLSHYDDTLAQSRRIVDLYEQAHGVENIDLFDVGGSYDTIVAISTLEHVRWEEDGAGVTPWEQQPYPEGPLLAVKHLRSLLRSSGALLVTLPFGQHPYLDGAILANGLDSDWEATLLRRPDGRWTAYEGGRLWRPARELRWASAVWVGGWIA